MSSAGSPVQRAIQTPVVADLGSREWMKVIHEGATGEQVRPLPLEFARTGSRKDELLLLAFNQPVHLIEQLRHLLDLINEHPLGTRAALLEHRLEQRGRAGEPSFLVGVEKVDFQGTGRGEELLLGPRGLARSSGAEEEKTVCFQWVNQTSDLTPKFYAFSGGW
jgi:hypothetical protein